MNTNLSSNEDAFLFGSVHGFSRCELTYGPGGGLYVPEAMQRKGVARMLYNFLEEDVIAKAREVKSGTVTMRVEAGAAKFMKGALPFWEEMGYTATTTGKNSGPTPMEKMLTLGSKKG